MATLHVGSEGIGTDGVDERVGIGTDQPASKLDVAGGDVLIRGSNNWQNPGDEAVLNFGDAQWNHIKAVRGDGVKISAFGNTDALTIKEGGGVVLRNGPWYDVRAYGASGSNQAITGSITTGSNTLSLDSPGDFRIGQGIKIVGAGVDYADLITAVTAITLDQDENEVAVTIRETAGSNVQHNGVLHDDTAAIQAALDLVGSQGGGTVLLPNGTYNISSTLIVKASTVLEGSGHWASTIQVSTNASQSFPAVALWDQATVNNFRIITADISQIPVPGSGWTGVLIGADLQTGGQGGWDALVSGIYINGMDIGIADPAWDNDIRDCMIQNCNIGINSSRPIELPWESNDNIITNCGFSCYLIWGSHHGRRPQNNILPLWQYQWANFP